MRTRARVHLSSGGIILPLFFYSISDHIPISTGATPGKIIDSSTTPLFTLPFSLLAVRTPIRSEPRLTACHTSLLLRYADDSYSDQRSPSAECFRLKVEQVDDDEVRVRLWFPTPTKRFKDRDAVMVCFDCTSASSYATAAACLDALAKRDCVKVLVATKTDLVASRAVDGNTALALAEQHQIPFFETSAKQNVQLPFRHIAQAWLMRQKAADGQREASAKKGRQRKGTSGA